ncbi:MAG: c-type cytochrome [Syntrophothermus sp.]
MKKSILTGITMAGLALFLTFPFTGCNSASNKNTSETQASTTRDSTATGTQTSNTVTDTGRNQNGTTMQTKPAEKTDAPSPRGTSGTTKTSTNRNETGTKTGENQNQQNAKQQTAQSTWNIPANEKSRKNPVKSESASIENGKELFAKHCTSCHGKSGQGNGPRANTLKSTIRSFKDPGFQAQTDGAIFYQTSEGKGEMPAYKKKLAENDIWNIVNYIRSLK